MDANAELRKEAARALGRIGDSRVAEPVLAWLASYLCPCYGYGPVTSKTIGAWTRDMKSLFGDYAPHIVRTFMCVECEARETRRDRWEHAGHTYTGESHGRYEYGLSESDTAIECLCSVPSQVSSNILYFVLRKQDYEVKVCWNCALEDYGVLSFSHQRERAKAELETRGNPPYDPCAYTEEGAWTI